MIQITANAVDVTTQIVTSSFRVEQNITTRVDLCTFVYRKTPSRSYRPVTGHEIIVTDGATTVFAGQITEITENVVETDTVQYNIMCRDYTFLLDRRLVANTYRNQSISQILTAIVTEYATDLTATGICACEEPTFSEIIFDYEKPSDIFRDFAELTGYDWWVGYDKVVYFQPKDTTPAPFEITDTASQVIKGSLELRRSDKQLRNVIYVQGDDYIGEETFDKFDEGDGEQESFRLPYRYSEQPRIFVNDVEQTVGIEFLDIDGFQAYWNANEKTVTFTTAPPSGHSLDVIGTPLIPLFVKVTGPDLSKGVFEHKITDRTLQTREAVRSRALAEIDAYGSSADAGRFRTYTAVQAGQQFTITSPLRNISMEKYVAHKIRIKMHGINAFEYGVELTNSRVFELVEFMRFLLRRGDKTFGGVRNAVDVLLTILSARESLEVTENLTLNRNAKAIAENLELTENFDLKTNFTQNFVWGDYATTDINDPNRVPVWDGGATWS